MKLTGKRKTFALLILFGIPIVYFIVSFIRNCSLYGFISAIDNFGLVNFFIEIVLVAVFFLIVKKAQQISEDNDEETWG